MTFWKKFLTELHGLYDQIVALSIWVWVPLYLLAFVLLAALALGLHP